MSRIWPQLVAGSASALLLFALAVPASSAAAVTLEVGKPEASTNRSSGTEYEPSSVNATEVVLSLRPSSGEGEFIAEVIVDGVSLPNLSFLQGATLSRPTLTYSFIVGPGQKWKWKEAGSSKTFSTHESVYEPLNVPTVAGPEGKEGKEGKTGATGPAGSEGKEGKEGKESTSLMSFSTPAKENLSEIKETVEVVGWCVIGTMLAGIVALMFAKILGGHRR